MMEAAGNTIFSDIYETQKKKEGLQSVFFFLFLEEQMSNLS